MVLCLNSKFLLGNSGWCSQLQVHQVLSNQHGHGISSKQCSTCSVVISYCNNDYWLWLHTVFVNKTSFIPHLLSLWMKRVCQGWFFLIFKCSSWKCSTSTNQLPYKCFGLNILNVKEAFLFTDDPLIPTKNVAQNVDQNSIKKLWEDKQLSTSRLSAFWKIPSFR